MLYFQYFKAKILRVRLLSFLQSWRDSSSIQSACVNTATHTRRAVTTQSSTWKPINSAMKSNGCCNWPNEMCSGSNLRERGLGCAFSNPNPTQSCGSNIKACLPPSCFLQIASFLFFSFFFNCRKKKNPPKDQSGRQKKSFRLILIELQF